MTNENQFDGALTQALQARRLPEPSSLFAAKLQARRALDVRKAAAVPQAGMPLYAAAGSLTMGLLIGIMLFGTLNLPTAEAVATTSTDSSAAILYHYIYKSAV